MSHEGDPTEFDDMSPEEIDQLIDGVIEIADSLAAEVAAILDDESE